MNLNIRIVVTISLVAIAVIAISVFLKKVKRDAPSSFPSKISSSSEKATTSASGGPTPALLDSTEVNTYDGKLLEDTWSGDSMFPTADLELVDDSSIKAAIEGARLNKYRVVEVNAAELREQIRKSISDGEVVLNLFKDLTVHGTAYESKEYHDGVRAGFSSWRGNVTGEAGSSFVIVVAPDGETTIQIAGEIGSYRISKLSHSSYHLIVDYGPSNISYEGDTY